VFDRILAEIDVLEKLEWHRDGLPPQRRLSFQRGLLRWIAVTAAACLLLVAGIYLLRSPSPATVTPSGPIGIISPIGPGGNKAVLTLGNGSSIVLDSIANGRLTGQGAEDVVKLADGKLQYRGGAGNGGKNDNNGVRDGNHPDAGILYNTLTTPRGGQYQVVLSDGTKVWLNAASAIRYPTAFTGKNREVEVRGEAYFEVARNEVHPFKVNIIQEGNKLPEGRDRMSIEVLGTSFNIKAYQDEADKQIHTTLLEGAVRVSLGAKAQVIRPGQQANITFDDRYFSIRNDVDLESVMAWKNGKLVFNKGSIRELMLEISRWYDVDIRYQGNVPSGGFYGLIDRNVPLTSILHVLDAYGIKTKLENNKTIVIQ
jgi:ferric-dicitrate binding protein FerR (iron transport regulator)